MNNECKKNNDQTTFNTMLLITTKKNHINKSTPKLSYRYNSSTTTSTNLDFDALMGLAANPLTETQKTVAKLDVYINISYSSLVDPANKVTLDTSTICHNIRNFFNAQNLTSYYRLDLTIYFLRDGTNKSFAKAKDHLNLYDEALKNYDSCVNSLSKIFKLDGNDTKAKAITSKETYAVLKSRSFLLNKKLETLTKFFIKFKQEMSDTAAVDINKDNYTTIANFNKLYFQHSKSDITVIQKNVDSNIKKTWRPLETDLFINTNYKLVTKAIENLTKKTPIPKHKKPTESTESTQINETPTDAS